MDEPAESEPMIEAEPGTSRRPPAKRPRVSKSDMCGSLMVRKNPNSDEVTRYINMQEEDIADDKYLILYWKTLACNPLLLISFLFYFTA